MAKFRKKQIVIDAWLWDETKETLAVLRDAGMKCGRFNSHVTANYVRNLGIETLEGTMTANLGDWIIRGVKGEFYPCKPDIFEASYDKHCEERAVECAEEDLLGEAIRLLDRCQRFLPKEDGGDYFLVRRLLDKVEASRRPEEGQ